MSAENREAQMSNDNVLNFAEWMRRRDTARILAAGNMAIQEEGIRLLFPAVEKMREMGLSGGEIGLLFKFVGAFCGDAAAEGEESKPST
jgi:hypothetical protein